MTIVPDPEVASVDNRADALDESVEALSSLVMVDEALPETLTQIADLAARAIPGADGAGLTLFLAGDAETRVSSAPFVTETDDLQYGLGEGPCITAAREGRTVISGSLGDDSSYPTFGPRAAQLGVHSSLSLPLFAGQKVVGSLNVYSHAKFAFDGQAAKLGELFAVPAAVSVQNAQALAEAQRLASRLGQILLRRAVDTEAARQPWATEELTYQVAWSIEVDAHSAQEAAQAALHALADERSTAHVFQVTHQLPVHLRAASNAIATGNVTMVSETVDLNPDDVEPDGEISPTARPAP